MTQERKKQIISCGLCLVCIGVLLLCILLPLSYSVIELNEYGLYHSRWSEELYMDENRVESGRYFTGLAGEMITFPRTKMLIVFEEGYDGKPEEDEGIKQGGGNALQAWTKEGANVYLETGYFFSLEKSRLLDMYKQFGEEWRSFLVRLSFSVLKETTVLFTTNEFVTNTSTVATKMKEALTTAMNTNFSGAVKIETFQLQKISFDSTLDNAINNKLVQAYKKKSYEYEQTISVTRKNTEKDVQDRNNQIRVIQATQSDALAIQYELEQLGTSLNLLVANMTTSYGNMKTSVTSNVTQLFRMIYVTELKLDNNLKSVTFLDDGVTKTISGSY